MASRNVFSNLYDDIEFTDVTIACDDNHRIEAHKVVLSLCSNFFRKILVENRNPHPLIYMQGVNIEVLKLLKKFIYLGKANVEQKMLQSFLLSSKTLLNHTESVNENRMKQENNDTEDLSFHIEKSMTNKFKTVLHHSESVTKNTMKLEKNCTEDTMENNLDDNKIMKIKQDKPLRKKGNFICSTCNFKSNFESQLKIHIKKHQSLFCSSCGLVFNGKQALREHVVKEHENLKCTVLGCVFTAASIYKFHRHKFDHHSELKQCDQCEYSTRRFELLKGHMETHSSNLIYICKQCDFRTNTRQKITFHKRKVHLGIFYECNVCSFKTAKSSNLNAHKLIHYKNEETKTSEKEKRKFNLSASNVIGLCNQIED